MSKEYIEKEAVIRNFCKGCGLFDTDDCACTSKVRCDEYDAILDTPPADVKPVVRGEWEERYIDDAPMFMKRRWYCSACGHWQTYGELKFCSNCGADMRGEK